MTTSKESAKSGSNPDSASTDCHRNQYLSPVTMKRIGCALSALVSAFFLFLFIINTFFPEVNAQHSQVNGLPLSISFQIGVLAGLCFIAYSVPQTAFLGAILISAYLGGAIAINIRILMPLTSPPIIICVVTGLAAWGGLYLRDKVVRQLLPFRNASGSYK